ASAATTAPASGSSARPRTWRTTTTVRASTTSASACRRWPTSTPSRAGWPSGAYRCCSRRHATDPSSRKGAAATTRCCSSRRTGSSSRSSTPGRPERGSPHPAGAYNAPVPPRYVRPDWFTTHVFNPFVALLTRAGLSVYGSRVLAVRGRRSGEWRTTPVNPLTLDGERYLVSPRGNTQWVRNMRVAGGGELRAGRRGEEVTAAEAAVEGRGRGRPGRA